MLILIVDYRAEAKKPDIMCESPGVVSERRTVLVRPVGRRQVCPGQHRLDVDALAKSLVDSILTRRNDGRLEWDGEKRVRLVMGTVLPEGAAVKETLAGRRRRLRDAVAGMLADAGWRMVRANVFERLGG